jgi:hypothetical protein
MKRIISSSFPHCRLALKKESAMEDAVNLSGSNRLIVLLPDCLANNTELARKVYWLALHDQCELIYLTLVDDEADIALVGCHMETMKNMTASSTLPVHCTITLSAHWLQALQEVYRPGDRVICQSEQVVRNGWFGTLPVSEYLRQKAIPVSTISGIYHPVQQQVHQWLRELLTWVGFMLIILFFTWFEVQIDPVLPGWTGKLFLTIAVVFEISLLWVWNTVSKK